MVDVYSPIRRFNYSDIAAQHARSRPNELALVDGDVRLTFGELEQRVSSLCSFLKDNGCGEGERILWFCQNSFRLFEVLLAAARLGAIFCPANWRMTSQELEFILSDLEPVVVFWQSQEIGETVSAARERYRGPARWVQHDASRRESDGYEGLLATQPASFESPQADWALPMLAIYTSAFEGQPNAALIPQQAMMLQDMVIAEAQEIGPDTVYLACGPLFHIGAFMAASATFHAGGLNVVAPRIDAEDLLRLIQQERCTHGFIPGPTIEEMRKLNADGRYDVSSMWSAPDAPEWTNPIVSPASSPWAKRLGGYGQTEVTGLVTLASLGGELQAGRPTAFAEVGIFDDADRELGPGEVGEIRVKGPMVFCGYYNRPELNSRRVRNGWHCTHDLGKRAEDGSIQFVGPKMKMIKSASENIYPIEVENALKKHPAVADACVIGIPDERWEQSVKALVVVEPGQDVTEEEVIAFCKSQIASYKKPRIVEFIESVVRKGGEIDRERMDELYGGGGYPSL